MSHVLITNDDGIDSYFLKILVENLMPRFKVTVVAPQREQSWIGRSFSRHRTVSWQRSYQFEGCEAYAVDGTPSDCVNIAMGNLLTDTPDIVCSGINVGVNATLPVIFASGTVAGAMEGAFWGLPALAFSQQLSKQDFAAMTRKLDPIGKPVIDSIKASGCIAADLTLALLESPEEDPCVHNINFPVRTTLDTPQEFTRLAPCKMPKLFTPESPDTYTFKHTEKPDRVPEDSDYACLERGHISKSVLRLSSLC